MTHFKLSAVNTNVNSVSQKDSPLTALSSPPQSFLSLNLRPPLFFFSATLDRQGHLLSQSNPNDTQLGQALLILLHLCFSHVHHCFLSNLRLARASFLSTSGHVLMGRKYSLFKIQSTPLSSSFFVLLRNPNHCHRLRLSHPPSTCPAPRTYHPSFQGSDFFPCFLQNPFVFDMILVCFV